MKVILSVFYDKILAGFYTYLLPLLKGLQMKEVKKVFIKTLGCQMNEYDSSRMYEVLNEHFTTTKTLEYTEADIIIINTCSIRERAQEKVFHELGRWKNLKKDKKDLIIGVGGCVASQEGKNIIKRAPFVDIVFGPQTIHRLPELIKEKQRTKKSQVDISFPEIEKFDQLPEPKAEGTKAYVSIMEGCDKYCSFCVVPYTRGPEINRPFEDVLAECAILAEQGVKEITLLGQNVNHYLGPMDSGQTGDLALLVHFIAEIDNVERIRFMTSHPVEFSQNLIDTFATVPKLANHLHLPVQHGSDKILTTMKRNHTILEFKQKIRKLRAIRDDITISSDFIVGFPGETDEDFQKLLNLVKEVNFDQSYSFLYSKRPGTPAADIPDTTPIEVKKARLQQLQDQLHCNAEIISRQMVGTTQKVLIEGPSKKHEGLLSGRTDNNRFVHFEGETSLIGTFLTVKITDAKRHSLTGYII